jgi:hypothetical protein
LWAILQNSDEILGKAQTMMEARWAHFSPCLQMFQLAASKEKKKSTRNCFQPIGNKDSSRTY